MGRKIHPLMVKETKELLSGVEGFISVDLTGVTAEEATALRKNIRIAGGRIRMLRNSVVRQSLEEVGMAEAASSVVSQSTALAWADGDAIVPVCRILSEWKAKSRRIDLKGGWVQGRVLSKEEVCDLALIPDRKQLHGMVVGTLASPISRLVRTLNGLLTGFAVVLKNISDRRGEDG